MNPPLISIDGPAGSGKSSTGLAVGKRLGIPYLDTGAMYRASAWAVLNKGINPENKPAVIRIIDDSDFRIVNTERGSRIFIDEQEATPHLRTKQVTKAVTPVCEIPEVRTKLVNLQRNWAARGFGVIEGRDIGTVVLPEAGLKIFMTARPEIRARRRAIDIGIADDETKVSELTSQIAERDRRDRDRKNSPLTLATDMIELDNSDMSFNEQVNFIISLASERFEITAYSIAKTR